MFLLTIFFRFGIIITCRLPPADDPSFSGYAPFQRVSETTPRFSEHPTSLFDRPVNASFQCRPHDGFALMDHQKGMAELKLILGRRPRPCLETRELREAFRLIGAF
jgi:hypothetical protein